MFVFSQLMGKRAKGDDPSASDLEKRRSANVSYARILLWEGYTHDSGNRFT